MTSLLQLCGILTAGLAGARWGPSVINVDAATYLVTGLIALYLQRRRLHRCRRRRPGCAAEAGLRP